MYEVIEFTSGAQRIAATICTPDRRTDSESHSGIVFVHGLDSDRRGYVEYGEQVAVELSITCLALDLSGHGASTGARDEISPGQHLQDVVAAWDELAARSSADPRRIAVCGASYGACLAALTVRHREVARLLLRAPTIIADDDIARPLRLRSRHRDPASASELFDGLRSYTRPVLVVESEKDETIPHHVIEAYLTALPAAKHKVIAGAAHVLSRPEWRQIFIALLLGFVADL